MTTTASEANNDEVRTHLRTCPLCEAMCGLEIQTEGDRVTRVRGDRDDVWSKGYLCPKGAALGHLHHDPDRHPRRRWSATATSGARSRGTRRSPAARSCCGRSSSEHGIAAVTAYIGNPAVHNYSLSRYTGAVAGMPAHADHLVGRHRRPVAEEPRLRPAVRQPVEHPDPRRAPHRPVRRHGRQPARVAGLAALVPRPHRRDRPHPRARRAHDRRSTRAAPARPSAPTSGSRSSPGMDAAFLLAVVNVLDSDGLVRLGPLDGRVQGIDEVLRRRPRLHARGGRADACGVPAERIRRLAHELADDRARRRLRPHRPVQPGVRHARLVGRRRRQRAHRPPRRRGRRDVPDAGDRDDLADRAPARAR